MKKWIAALMGAACCLVAATPAAAFTECTGKVLRIYYGDAGQLWFFLDSGAIAAINPADPDRPIYLSMMITAKATNQVVALRFAENGATCATTHSDMVGIWLP